MTAYILNILKTNIMHIVGISGGTAIGKMFLAKKLFETIDGCIILSQDSFYIDANEEANFDVKEAIDLRPL